MNTKIDGLGGPRLEPQARRVGSPGQDAVGAISSANALRLGEDSVQISASASATPSAGFDAAKVQQLRADIEAGRYTVDARALAARLMEIEGSLK